MKRVVKWITKFIVLPVLVLLIVATGSLLIYRVILQHELLKNTQIASPNGIDSLEPVTLGGLQQWILLRGERKSNPVLLVLHGGPGFPRMIFSRSLESELVKHFVVVHWDQRGTGKSYDPDISENSMNIEQFVSDTNELVDHLRSRFNNPRIYLVGGSWGSILGLHTVTQYPEKFYAFIGVSQVVNFNEGEKNSYQFASDYAKRTNNQKAIKALTTIGPPPYNSSAELFVQRRWLTEAGGMGEIGGLELMKMFLASPDYTLGELVDIYRGFVFSLDHMLGELQKTNFQSSITRIDVPVYFFHGRHDNLSPAPLLQHYFDTVEAPQGKTLIWFERSGHLLTGEEPVKYQKMLINKVLKETYSN